MKSDDKKAPMVYKEDNMLSFGNFGFIFVLLRL